VWFRATSSLALFLSVLTTISLVGSPEQFAQAPPRMTVVAWVVVFLFGLGVIWPRRGASLVSVPCQVFRIHCIYWLIWTTAQAVSLAVEFSQFLAVMLAAIGFPLLVHAVLGVFRPAYDR